MQIWKSRLMALGVASIIFATTLMIMYTLDTNNVNAYSYDLKSFSSYDELIKYFSDAYGDRNESGGIYYSGGGIRFNPQLENDVDANGEKSSGAAPGFSKTNVQVEGVDEPDIVKTDGQYLYVISRDTVYIINAYPPENSSIITSIYFENWPRNLFISGDKLVVLTDSYRNPEVTDKTAIYYWGDVTTTSIFIYNITDPINPKTIATIEMDGYYFDARLIGEHIYVISADYTYIMFNGNEFDDVTICIPETRIDNETKQVPPTDIYYFDMPDHGDTMTHIAAIDLHHLHEFVQKVFLVGSTHTLYVSERNIYLTQTASEYQSEIILKDASIYPSPEHTTIIHRLAISNGSIQYVCKGEIPGTVLNQFSMDEHEGLFRIATTQGEIWRGDTRNNLYVLNENLTIIGAVENIAPGERIYSVRFMDEHAYMVTFKNTDPFYTIDISDPYNPFIAGALKIPGYSDYLHPYDEFHIIGIGKDTIESDQPDFAWYQGVKIAIFDVFNFSNPIELTRIIIGDRGTYSPVLSDHKALLFDREKELFVIPVSVYAINETLKTFYTEQAPASIYGDFIFQGVYVYHLNLIDGFELLGKITHMNTTEYASSEYRWYNGADSVERSLYIGDALYTISQNMVKIHSLITLDEIAVLNLE